MDPDGVLACGARRGVAPPGKVFDKMVRNFSGDPYVQVTDGAKLGPKIDGNLVKMEPKRPQESGGRPLGPPQDPPKTPQNGSQNRHFWGPF